MLKEIFKPTRTKVIFSFGVAVLYLIIIYSIPSLGVGKSLTENSLSQILLNLSFSLVLITLLYYPMSCGLFGIYAAIRKSAGWRPFLVPIFIVLLWNPLTFHYLSKALIKSKPQVISNQPTQECGLTVVSISDFSKAGSAGLYVEDVVTGIDGVKITSVNDFISIIQKRQPGDISVLETDHGKISVELVSDPSGGGPVLGVKFKETNCQKAPESGKPSDQNQNIWSKMDQGPYRDRVSFATGTSPTEWTDSEIILAEHASVPDVVYRNGIIYVYFVDVSQDGKPEQIGLLRSSNNGLSWDEKQIISINGLGSKIAVDPNPFLLDDGRIRLYYFDIGQTRTGGTRNNIIYSAVSSDGINFTEESGSRFSKADIFDPAVIKIGNVWRMYVGTGNQQVLTATSEDGLTFTYEGVALTGGAIPNVIFENNLYYLFTGGIEISTSTDGKTFTKTQNRFDSGGLTADPGVIKLSDNQYFMVYKTDDGSLKKLNNY